MQAVSAQHARIKNQEDRLLVIDLDSTNGTFINDKRLNPGVVAAVSSGNSITFGTITSPHFSFLDHPISHFPFLEFYILLFYPLQLNMKIAGLNLFLHFVYIFPKEKTCFI